MNDTMGENGLVLSRLVFSTLPQFRILNSESAKQKDRVAAIKTTEAEINTVVAERRHTETFHRNIPLGADRF